MAAPKKLSELVATISANTAIFEEYFQKNNLPTPSFDEIRMPLTLPGNIQAAREAVMDATMELQASILGPVGNIAKQTYAVCFTLLKKHNRART